jgi:hypothetical protein
VVLFGLMTRELPRITAERETMLQI